MAPHSIGSGPPAPAISGTTCIEVPSFTTHLYMKYVYEYVVKTHDHCSGGFWIASYEFNVCFLYTLTSTYLIGSLQQLWSSIFSRHWSSGAARMGVRASVSRLWSAFLAFLYAPEDSDLTEFKVWLCVNASYSRCPSTIPLQAIRRTAHSHLHNKCSRSSATCLSKSRYARLDYH